MFLLDSAFNIQRHRQHGGHRSFPNLELSTCRHAFDRAYIARLHRALRISIIRGPRECYMACCQPATPAL